MGRTTDEIRKRIERKEERLGRELTNEEKRKIEKSVVRKRIRENFIRGGFLALGITFGAGGHALLTSGEDEPYRPPIENEQERKEFVDRLIADVSVLTPEEKDILVESQIRDNVEQEIRELETKDEILNYLKEIYIDEYNKQNDTNYTIEQLELRKARSEHTLYRDVALNGDQIIREGYGQKSNVDTIQGVVTAKFREGDKVVISDEVICYFNKYRTIYSGSEQVDKYEDIFLVKMAPLISAGIDWSVAKFEDNYRETNNTYIRRFMDAAVDYKVNQINEIAQPNEQTEEVEHEQ